MSARELFTFRNPYFSAGIGVTAGLLVLSVLGGFIWLPYAQSDLKFAGLWDAICSAAGLPQRSAPVAAPAPAHRLSEAVLTPTMLAYPSKESIGRGATLAQRCAICHGPTGISRADSPNLAGQYASVIYKELLDFRSGARTNAVMSPFAVNLSGRSRCRGLLCLPAPAARLPSGAAASEAAHRNLRRAVARDCSLRLMPWQPGQQGR